MNGPTIMIGQLELDKKKGCEQTNYQTIIYILLSNGC